MKPVEAERIRYSFSEWPVWLSIIAFNFCWFLCLRYDAYAVAVIGFYLFFHGCLLVKNSPKPYECLMLDTLWSIVVMVIGLVIESMVFYLGIIQLSDSHWSLNGVPIWLVVLWGVFALSFRFGLAPSHYLKPWWLAIIGSAVCFSYFAGVKINSSVSLAEPVLVQLFIISCYWSVLFPVLMTMYKKFVLGDPRYF